MSRPLKFQTVEELQQAIDGYFEGIKETLYINADGVHIYEPLTITGLALALDTTRQTLMDYENRDEFTDTIKKAKTRIENYAEKRLFGTAPTGAIFALKNYGWKDKTESDITSGGKEISGKTVTNLILSELPTERLEEILANQAEE
jgi:hypothetical protein